MCIYNIAFHCMMLQQFNNSTILYHYVSIYILPTTTLDASVVEENGRPRFPTSSKKLDTFHTKSPCGKVEATMVVQLKEVEFSLATLAVLGPNITVGKLLIVFLNIKINRTC